VSLESLPKFVERAVLTLTYADGEEVVYTLHEPITWTLTAEQEELPLKDGWTRSAATGFACLQMTGYKRPRADRTPD
jgi:hypothetical protein